MSAHEDIGSVSPSKPIAEPIAEPIADTTLIIVCGSGPLPTAVADAAIGRGRGVFLIAIDGWADRLSVARYPHAWIKLGQLGRVWRLMRQAGARDFVCVGGLVRPSVRSLRLDWETVRLLPRLYRLFRGGDDHMLSGLGRMFEERGFRPVAAHDVAPDILLPEGALTRRQPSAQERVDAAYGLSLLDAMGPFDIGQAVVVSGRRVLAVEAAEGTDQMLSRVAELRANGRINLPAGTGILVKAPKPQQDRRFDLPSIGPKTVDLAVKASLAGIAVRSGGVIGVDPVAMTTAADAGGIFITAISSTAALAP
jgi:DUF1009 family protein